MKAGLLAQLRKTDLALAKRLGIVVLGILVFTVMTPGLIGLRLNNSRSLPVGIYMVTSDRAATLVEFCPAQPYGSLAAARGYRDEGNCADGGAPLMKPIAARSGDHVEVSVDGVAVNGNILPNSAALAVDPKGRTLEHWPFGKYVVESGMVWVISSYNRRSFDSRYFGPVSVASVRDRVRPLFTLR